MVSAMDERLAAMERELATTKAQNRLLMQRLRQVAMAYRSTAGPAGAAGAAMSSMGAARGGSRGRGGPGTLGTFAPAAMARAAPTAAHLPASTDRTPDAVRVSAAGVAQGAIPLSEVSFHGRQVWPGGRVAVRSYLDEALDRMGIRDPRARANWIPGMMTIAEHESSFRADAINLTDSNAWGPR